MRIPLISLILLILLTFGCDWYIFYRIRKDFVSKWRNKVAWIHGILSLIFWVILIVFICWPKRNPDEPIVTPMWLLFTFLSVYIPKFIFSLISLIGSLISKKQSVRAKCDKWVGLPIALLIFVFIWSGVFYTSTQIDVNKVEIVSDRLPQSMDGLRILQFSDIHLGTWGNDTTFISQFVESINAQNADIVVFTGDFVNRTADEMTPFIPVLKRIKAPMGVYSVLGNHDYGGYATWPDKDSYNKNLSYLKSSIDSLGWVLLCNQTTYIRNNTDSIAMIGVENWGEPPFNQLGDLVKAYGDSANRKPDLNDNVFKVLMTHNPNHWKEVVTKISNVDLSLAGHTHAMQFMLDFVGIKWSPSVWKYQQWGGLYSMDFPGKNPMHIYVNIGAGEVGMPARLGSAKPEINIITLRSKH